jgi:hypothetical protein
MGSYIKVYTVLKGVNFKKFKTILFSAAPNHSRLTQINY